MIASAHPTDEMSLKAFREFGAEAVTDNRLVVEKSDIVFIAVKPNVVKPVLSDIKSAGAGGKLFVSIAMGITLKEIEDCLLNDARVIRVMPNTPAMVKAACSVLVRGVKATDGDAALIKNMLESIGTCDEISDEYLMDTVTALSGSGPAYVSIFEQLNLKFFKDKIPILTSSYT
jgi:pyrroline-5-carboxylate reductase